MASQHDIGLNSADYQKYLVDDYSFIFSRKNLISTLKKGDIVCIKNDPNYDYRNGGKLVWDGEKLINLEYSVDDYGAAPKSLPVGASGFSATHWEEVIVHNAYVYATFNPDIHDIIYNFSIGERDCIDAKMIEEYQVVFDTVSKNIYHFWQSYPEVVNYRTLSFVFNDTRWGIVLPGEDEEDYDASEWFIPYDNDEQVAIFSYINDDNRKRFNVKDVALEHTLYIGQLY